MLLGLTEDRISGRTIFFLLMLALLGGCEIVTAVRTEQAIIDAREARRRAWELEWDLKREHSLSERVQVRLLNLEDDVRKVEAMVESLIDADLERQGIPVPADPDLEHLKRNGVLPVPKAGARP